ncbi:unnamed protein product [Adineta steineri]|uniref:Hepatitis TT virus Orf2/Gyrovirus Vp2 N-terminal domain-containing protein n=1 Tax=Adineta steineri TaxID=433720 RepID=A0A813RNE6_9BILA|nr:unnamed protein product [Adineta steineri]CAF0787664.1 unnamed protein product [Adineta steineri]CAF0941577.1 unnamed protein product [Adineta steineri]
MALAMNATVTVSCEANQEQSGPTIVHSTGVQNYRIQPELIRLLQESCSNDNLCDHEKGVQCTHPPAHILDVFKKAGFTVTSESNSGSRKLWMLTKTEEGGSSHPSGPTPTPHKPDAKPTPKPTDEEEEPAEEGNDEEEAGEEEEEEEEK